MANDCKETLFFVPYCGGSVPNGFVYSSEHEPLIRFFNRSAKKNVDELISKIFIIKNDECDFVGYIAISLKSLKKDALSTGKTQGLFDRPAIVIGQLIIDERFRKCGFGSTSIKFVISIVRLLKKYLPCRLLFVEAIDDNAKSFYEKRGFLSLKDDPFTLVLDLLPILKE